ncbi:MFS transporter [Actinopolymorpha pittospori]
MYDNQAGGFARSTEVHFRRPGLTTVLLAVAQLIISVDYNIVYMAVPEIGAGLDSSPPTSHWVLGAYAVAFGGFLLLGGRACDVFGPRRMFVLGLVLHAVSSLVGGLAAAAGPLLAARVVQGLGAALLFPATLTLLSSGFAPGRERNRAFAVWGTAGGAGLILGLLLGGVLTQAFGWPAIFYVNVPLAAVAVVLALLLIRPGVATPRTRAARACFNGSGTLTATAGVTLVVFSLVQGAESGWLTPVVLGAAAVGLVLLWVFVRIQRRGNRSSHPLRLLGGRDLRTGVLVTFLYMGTFGTPLYFLTTYFQTVHRYGALRTGLAFLVPMAGSVAGPHIASRLASSRGTRTAMVTSLLVGGIGVVLIGRTLGTGTPYTALIPGLLLMGVGQGAAYTLMFGAATSRIASPDRGIAAGMTSTAQQIGGAVGLAVLVAVANFGTQGMAGTNLAATTNGLRVALLTAAVGIAATALIVPGFSDPQPVARTAGDATLDAPERLSTPTTAQVRTSHAAPW